MTGHNVDLAGVCTGPGPCVTTPMGAGKNWVTDVGGLPLYIRAIAQALRRNGHSESNAIQLAVGTVKRWARGEGNVTAATRARAAAALAEWERKKAQAHSLSTPATPSIDLATDVVAVTMPAGSMPGPNGPRFPIRNHTDVKNAVRAVGRAKGDHAKVRRHIISRAKAIGGAHLIPDHWNSDGSVK